MTKQVIVIEGEDAAPEAVRPVIATIDSLGLDIEWQFPPWATRPRPFLIYGGAQTRYRVWPSRPS